MAAIMALLEHAARELGLLLEHLPAGVAVDGVRVDVEQSAAKIDAELRVPPTTPIAAVAERCAEHGWQLEHASVLIDKGRIYIWISAVKRIQLEREVS